MIYIYMICIYIYVSKYSGVYDQIVTLWLNVSCGFTQVIENHTESYRIVVPVSRLGLGIKSGAESIGLRAASLIQRQTQGVVRDHSLLTQWPFQGISTQNMALY